jgi:hypothetical protein
MSEDLAAHLKQLEEHLLTPAIRRDPALVASLLADDFREFGASGRIFDKASILAELVAEPPAALSLTNFECRPLTAGIALVTCRSTRSDASGTREALRSSLWVHRDNRWQLLFHQGTRL